MRHLLLCLALSIPPQPAPTKAQPAPEQADIQGYYSCRGQEASGKPYAGVVTIRKIGEVYMVQWAVADGFTGIGLRHGNSLSVSWAILKDDKALRGVNVYKISEPGPKLVGKWATIPGNGRILSETLVFLKALDPEPEVEEPVSFTPLLPQIAKKKEARKLAPDISGETNHGVITQRGTEVIVTSASWLGHGYFRADGRLELLWTDTRDGRRGMGLYEVPADVSDTRLLIGRWGYTDGEWWAAWDAEGNLVGTTYADSFCRK